MSECVFCKKIPFVIHEFKNSYLIVGEHQTFPGYCVLVLKEHVKELFDLDSKIQEEFFKELVTSTKAVQKAFAPEKINVSSYGNMTPHLHWHIFPRKKTDKNWPNPPWTLMNEFKNHATTDELAQKVASSIRFHLQK